MKRFSEQLQNKANSVKLRVAEKRDLRERIVSYMEYHPMPISVRQLGETSVSEQVRLVHIPFWKILQLSGATLGILLLSVTYLAERAIPGDSLYAVKVGFNEEVRSTLARSPYEKVVWETERLNRRISEARLLASEGLLTEEVEVEVANAVREHSDNARREIEVLKQTDVEGAALASIQLSTAIDVQSTSLRSNDQASTTEGKSTAKIATVLAESKEAEAKRGEDSLPSYDRLMAQVESETTRAYELLSNIHELALPEEKTDIKRRLEDIERSVSSAALQLETDDVIARKQLVDSLQRTQRLIVFMTNIDVRSSITVEEIVPVTLTSDERIAKVKKTAEDTLRLVDLAESSISTSTATTTNDVLAKVRPALKESRAVAEEVLLSLGQPDFDLTTLEEKIKSAYAFADDSATILNVNKNEVPVEIVPELPVIESSSTSSASSTIEVVSTTTEPVIEV